MKIEQPMKAVLIFFICLLLYSISMIKLFGSMEITSDVEKNGYCISNYGEDWYNKRGTNLCKSKYSYKDNSEPIEFTQEQFRNYCPQNKLLSIKFYSDCFHKSGSIV